MSESEQLLVGLAMVAELVRLHGGTAAAESRQGEGATFTVRLPFGAPGAPVATADRPSPRQAYVDEARVVRAGLLFALRAIDSERVHAQRRYLYGLWTRALDPRPEIL